MAADYTAFCQWVSRSGESRGATWIGVVTVPDAPDQQTEIATAMEWASNLCSQDWSCGPSEVRCIGLIEGDVTVLHWHEEG